MSFFEIGAFLIGLSALFGFLNHRYLKLPHTIGLVMIALAASLGIIALDVLSPESEVSELVTGMLDRIDFHTTVMLNFLLFAGLFIGNKGMKFAVSDNSRQYIRGFLVIARRNPEFCPVPAGRS